MIPTFLRPERIPYASIEIIPASPLRLICSWCTTQVQDGALPASHTICPACTKKFEGGARGVATMLALVVVLLAAAPLHAQGSEYAGVAQDKSAESVTRRMDARGGAVQGNAPEHFVRPDVVAETVPPAPIGRLPFAVLVAGQASDLITTLESLHSGRGREGNVLWASSSTAGFVAIKTSSALAMGFAMHQLASHGHPRAAKVLGYVSGFALLGVGVHNARVGR